MIKYYLKFFSSYSIIGQKVFIQIFLILLLKKIWAYYVPRMYPVGNKSGFTKNKFNYKPIFMMVISVSLKLKLWPDSMFGGKV